MRYDTEATVLIIYLDHRHMNCVSHSLEHRVISAGIKAQMSAQALQVGTNKIRRPDGDGKGAGCQGGMASPAPPCAAR